MQRGFEQPYHTRFPFLLLLSIMLHLRCNFGLQSTLLVRNTHLGCLSWPFFLKTRKVWETFFEFSELRQLLWFTELLLGQTELWSIQEDGYSIWYLQCAAPFQTKQGAFSGFYRQCSAANDRYRGWIHSIQSLDFRARIECTRQLGLTPLWMHKFSKQN